MMKKALSCVVWLLAASGLCAGNAIFNGSFELGVDGFAVEKELRLDTNPELKYLPLETDEAAFNAGKKALKMANPYAEPFDIFSKEFQLEPAVKYRFSGMFKSSIAGDQLYFGVFKVDQTWSAHSQIFTPPIQWTRFSYEFTTADKAGYYHVHIRAGDRKKVMASTLWLDDLKIEKVGDNQPLPVEATVTADKKIYRRDVDEKVNLTLKVTNPQTLPFKTTIAVTGIDEYTGRHLFNHDVKVDLAAGESKSFTLAVSAERYCGVRLTASAPGLRSHDGFYVVIGQYTARPVDITKDYVVGVNGGTQYLSEPQTAHPSYKVFNAPFGTDIAYLGQMGCRIIREHDGGIRGVDWPAIEPEKGKFDFRHLDLTLALYEKNNIIMFPVIGNGFIENYKPSLKKSWPDWIKPLCERVKNDPPNCMDEVRGHILLPPTEMFQNYIYQTAKHIKGRVPVYEVTNEPNLYLASDVYVRYLQAARTAIKAADPQAQLCGFCLSSDFNVKTSQWMDECIKNNGLKYVDAIGFHPYEGRELGSIRAADRYIADLRREVAPYGNFPLWNTELYYLIDQFVRDSNEDTLCRPHHVVWRFLVDLGEGVTQSIALPSITLWKRMLTPNMLAANENFHELVPSENFVAYNAMARLFEGAKTVKKIRLDNGVIAYVFRKGGKLIAAIWNYDKRKGVFADFSSFMVMDIFGNPVKAEEKEIGEAPWYLTPGQLNDEQFLAGIERLKLRLEQPISVAPTARLAGGGLMISLYNDSSAPQPVIIGVSGNGITAVTPQPTTLSPRSRVDLTIPVKTGKTQPETATVMIYASEHLFKVPVKISKNLWLKSSEPFRLSNAEGCVTVTATAIRVDLQVNDSTNSGLCGKRQPWETDCVELFFDLNPSQLDVRHPTIYTADTFRLFITPRDSVKMTVWGTAVKSGDCQLNITPGTDGYRIQLTIPTGTRKYLGFDVKIDDAAVDRREIMESSLVPVRESHHNRCNFAIITQ